MFLKFLIDEFWVNYWTCSRYTREKLYRAYIEHIDKNNNNANGVTRIIITDGWISKLKCLLYLCIFCISMYIRKSNMMTVWWFIPYNRFPFDSSEMICKHKSDSGTLGTWINQCHQSWITIPRISKWDSKWNRKKRAHDKRETQRNYRFKQIFLKKYIYLSRKCKLAKDQTNITHFHVVFQRENVFTPCGSIMK